METLEITRQVQAKRYFLLKADYYVQLMMMWIIFGLSVTLIGIFISMLLMIPWGAIQIVSAAYNTYQRWDEVHYRKRYLGYWTLVLIIAALFYVRDHYDHWELNSNTLFVIGMALSLATGCYHTYLIHDIYKEKRQ